MKRKKKKTKMDIISMIFAIVFFFAGMVYQNFVNDKLFNEKEKMMHSVLSNFLGSKITFFNDLNNRVYMWKICKEKKKGEL